MRMDEAELFVRDAMSFSGYKKVGRDIIGSTSRFLTRLIRRLWRRLDGSNPVYVHVGSAFDAQPAEIAGFGPAAASLNFTSSAEPGNNRLLVMAEHNKSADYVSQRGPCENIRDVVGR